MNGNLDLIQILEFFQLQYITAYTLNIQVTDNISYRIKNCIFIRKVIHSMEFHLSLY